MKKIFNYLAAALLAGSSLAAVSCSDDPEETAQDPKFPDQVQSQTILPGESCTLTITPNMNWEVSIPEEALQWFYLDDKGTKVPKLHGAAVPEGGDPITIKIGVEDVEIFDPVDPVNVTMTMGTESKTIATLTIQHTERELKFYMAKIEEGEYVYNDNADLPDLDYSYETEAKPNGFSVQLEEHGAFYNARLLVESNVPWTISVPEWIEARVNTEVATSGAAGQSEVELRVNNTLMPLDGANEVCKFLTKAGNQNDPDIELAQITISLENLSGLFECDLSAIEALFSARGNYLANASNIGASLNGFVTAPEGATVIAIPATMNGGYEEWQGQQWVNAKIDPWSEGDKIQTRNVSISVEPNTGNMERKAIIFVLPPSLKEKTMSELLTEDKYDIREEYKQYLAATVTQEASKFLFNPQNSLAMKENGVTFEDGYKMFDDTLWKWDDWMHNSNELYYKLTYTNEYSADGGAIDVVPLDWCPSYTSYKIYGYNVGSAGENLTEEECEKWIQLQENRNATTNAVESFTVHMNFDEEYVNTYGDSKKYAVIVFYDENDVAIATLECEYNENATGGSDTGAVNFAYPEYAQQYDNSSIEQIFEGDADYDKYFAPYADYTPSVYRVTFTKLNPTMSTIAGLPGDGYWCEVVEGADWLSRPTEAASEVVFAGLMNSEKSAKGAYIFYSGGSGFDEATQKVIDPQGPAVILVINLVLE